MITQDYLNIAAQDLLNRVDKVLVNGIEVEIESKTIVGSNVKIQTKNIPNVGQVTLLQLADSNNNIIQEVRAGLELVEGQYLDFSFEIDVKEGEGL